MDHLNDPWFIFLPMHVELMQARKNRGASLTAPKRYTSSNNKHFKIQSRHNNWHHRCRVPIVVTVPIVIQNLKRLFFYDKLYETYIQIYILLRTLKVCMALRLDRL